MLLAYSLVILFNDAWLVGVVCLTWHACLSTCFCACFCFAAILIKEICVILRRNVLWYFSFFADLIDTQLVHNKS